MKYYCNPINIDYRYQFHAPDGKEVTKISREAADPSLILYKDHYYIFASMTLSVWVSSDLVNWESHPLPENLPLYDYAPDVRVINDYVYFSASKRGSNCNFYRTKDVINGPYEEIAGTFDFWDPHLFADDDGKFYFYWGCSNSEPIFGTELNPETMEPIGKKVELIWGKPDTIGFERVGENHSLPPSTEEEIDKKLVSMLKMHGTKAEEMPPYLLALARNSLSNRPFIEGAWMTKYQGKYYLQYAFPAAEYNVYGDGTYISDSPLGPFTLAANNPFSYQPGGFMPGAGHGSTMWDQHHNLWHASTMRISMNHPFERRVGIWPAGFDQDGELFCNQQYGDWPRSVVQSLDNPWKPPEWYLLSFKKTTIASSFSEGCSPALAVDENVQTLWKADSSQAGEWLEIDFEEEVMAHAIQINFADDKVSIKKEGELRTELLQPRFIDEDNHKIRWILEGSVDGEEYFCLEDKSMSETNLAHDLVVIEEGVKLRKVRLTILEVPYNLQACISGFRVFGLGNGMKPEIPEFTAQRHNDLDMTVSMKAEGAVGFNILWGHEEDKLYHSCLVFEEQEKKIGALVKGQSYFVRVDSFNEAGITSGCIKKLKYK